MSLEYVPIHVGHNFSRSHTFDEAQAKAFALSAGDTNPLHHDEGFAIRSGYAGLIVSGAYTGAVLTSVTGWHFSRSYSVLGISFFIELRRPVFVNAEMTMAWHVTAIAANTQHSQDLLLRGVMCDAQERECVTALGKVRVSIARNVKPRSDASARVLDARAFQGH